MLSFWRFVCSHSIMKAIIFHPFNYSFHICQLHSYFTAAASYKKKVNKIKWWQGTTTEFQPTIGALLVQTTKMKIKIADGAVNPGFLNISAKYYSKAINTRPLYIIVVLEPTHHHHISELPGNNNERYTRTIFISSQSNLATPSKTQWWRWTRAWKINYY